MMGTTGSSSVSTSTTTRIVNGQAETVTETIVQKPDGTIERHVETYSNNNNSNNNHRLLGGGEERRGRSSRNRPSSSRRNNRIENGSSGGDGGDGGGLGGLFRRR